MFTQFIKIIIILGLFTGFALATEESIEHNSPKAKAV